MFNQLIDLVFPKRSLTGSIGSWMTDDEKKLCKINLIHEDTARLRSRGLSDIDEIYAAIPYDTKHIKKLIHLFKYRRIPSLSSYLSSMVIQSDFPFNQDSVLCPVPLHWTRKYWRGFNQADVLAKEIGASYKISVINLLTRTRPTGHQARRTRSERLVALNGAFKCVAERSDSNKTVILLDDLSTTGATLNACAKTLKEAGFNNVIGWVVAHG